MQTEIDVLEFQRLSHPAYGPDLTLIDFRVFPKVKAQLREKCLKNANELKTETQKIIWQTDNDWYKVMFNKWIWCHRNCAAVSGDYVKKASIM